MTGFENALLSHDGKDKKRINIVGMGRLLNNVEKSKRITKV